MSFRINTNVPSLQAQDYLRVSAEFQQRTINRVTSGLRIVSSGDDAAGLAIANGFRSDQAVLTQGVRNANDGLSTLQIIDGGINNISKLLDRARTLATQSASGTFAGSRTVLNNEFQSLLAEIDRQAQAIGLNRGGQFAKALSVFIGGGKTSAGVSETKNGSVGIDLSNSTVDSRSLGLTGYEAAGVDGTDLSAGKDTSVANILANATNISSAGDGFTDFYFYGPGFGDSDRVKVSVNTAGVSDLATLTTAINSAIDAAGNGGTEAATAFQNSGIKAQVKTDTDGSQRLAFNSSNAAFQVRAGDRQANALLGNVTSATDPTGKAIALTVTGGVAAAAGATAIDNTAASDQIVVRVLGGGLTSPVDISINTNTNNTVALAVADLQTQVANNAELQKQGITLTGATAGAALVFTSAEGQRFEVQVAGDLGNHLGLGSFRLGGSGGSFSQGAFDYTQITGSGGDFTANRAVDFEFSVAGGTKIAFTGIDFTGASATARVDAAVAELNAAFLGNATARAAQLVASNVGDQLRVTSQNGTYFRLNAVGADASVSGFDNVDGIAFTANATAGGPTGYATTLTSGGASTIEATSNTALDFAAIRNATDDQAITISVADANGAEKSRAIVLKSDDATTAAGRSGFSLDQAIRAINRDLALSNDADFQKIVAVKDRIDDSNEGIRFISVLDTFKVSLGTNTSGGTVGINNDGAQGTVVNSETTTGGGGLDISNATAAENAVTALSTAVSKLGDSQAVVGRGQNQFSFAVNLAQSQLSNIAAAESRIRDADLAAEAANLTKAQIILQAGIAALGQANSAPQQVLALLRG